MLKLCTKCLVLQPTFSFYKNKNSKDGLRHWCKSCVSSDRAKYYKFHCDRVKAYNKNLRKADRDRIRKYHHDRYLSLRMDVLRFYGGDPPRCACPGCQNHKVEFLTIDHVNGWGKKHRKSIKPRDLCRWIKLNNYPAGFRVLCFNCNCSRGIYGYCPHENK